MAVLIALNSRCFLDYKLFSLLPARYYQLPSIQTPKGLLVHKKNLYLTPSRKISWDSFYLSISSSAPVVTFQNVLLDLHDFSGLPWWSVIMLTTLGIRSLFIFPLAVHQNQVICRLINLKAELGKMAPVLNKEVNIAAKMQGWDESTAKLIFRRNV